MTTSGMEAIERLTKAYADARGVLSERVTALHDEIEDAKRRKVPGIKTALARVAEAQSQLAAAIDEHRGLFDKPRTQVFHGVKVGLQKGKGAIGFADEAQVARLIHRHFPERYPELVKVTEKVRKSALGALSVDELKRIGCEAGETGDEVLIKATDSEVDKLVKALLKGIEDEDGEG